MSFLFHTRGYVVINLWYYIQQVNTSSKLTLSPPLMDSNLTIPGSFVASEATGKYSSLSVQWLRVWTTHKRNMHAVTAQYLAQGDFSILLLQ